MKSTKDESLLNFKGELRVEFKFCPFLAKAYWMLSGL